MTLQASIKGRMGELNTKYSHSLFLDPKEYHFFDNILIKTNGATQIDHIIVSKYGVFVIETKNIDAWIFGKPDEPKWTAKYYKSNFRFLNPLKQNERHIKKLAEVMRINPNRMFSVVVFQGKCEFKTIIQENVLKYNYTDYIKSKKLLLLPDREVERICRELIHIKANTSFSDGWRHTKMLKKRFEGS